MRLAAFEFQNDCQNDTDELPIAAPITYRRSLGGILMATCVPQRHLLAIK